jgi:hypothetical protein
MEQNAFYSELRELLASGDPKAFEAMAFKIGNAVLEEGIFPDDCFAGLLAIFKEEKFQLSHGSWKLIRVFEENWEQLSEVQRDALLPLLEAHYGCFSDWMTCFVISGILGELYRDNRAFEALRRLEHCQKEMPRSFVPHGLEHIVRDSADAELAMRALAELTKMQTDASAMVRDEVTESVTRLKERQTSKPS